MLQRLYCLAPALGLGIWLFTNAILVYNESIVKDFAVGTGVSREIGEASRKWRQHECVFELWNLISIFSVISRGEVSGCCWAASCISLLSFPEYSAWYFHQRAYQPLKEAEQREKETREEEEPQKQVLRPMRKSWFMWVQELKLGLKGCLDTPPPLPAALKRTDGLTQSAFEDKVHIPLGQTIAALIRRSLITRQDRAESRYSMHPLVHKWDREQPKTSTSQQSLWCQIAMTTLAKSIVRPLLWGYGKWKEDETWYSASY